MLPRSFRLPGEVEKHKSSTTAHIGDLTKIIYQRNGSVTYAIVPQTFQRAKYVLVDSFAVNNIPKSMSPKKIRQNVAERLAQLGPVSNLFTLDIWKNAAFIPYPRELASLQDILGIRDSWPFEERHVQILVDDILAGISSLHKVNLQKSLFSVKDILLVRRQNLLYFQIAGLEDCTCFEGIEPTDRQELQSFRNILQLVDGRNKAHRSDLISALLSTLSNSQVLGSKELEAAYEKVRAKDDKLKAEYQKSREDHEKRRAEHESLPSYHKDIVRTELDVYIDAVRVLGTTFGGTISQNQTPEMR
ncbi:hypothetical protein AG0111_0g11676 [Alternaria gaisen]|uniref:Uncharacterized protein n=1 Tax=Alternaria gaisen TaxID=167740 RepID=A0ACB6F6Z1_9PLEO|nr:hypothetical protein AG0111_0g11676 [Alternaria gaisen]